jgi:hypothetical protein
MLNPEEIRVAPFGRVLVTDVGSTAPTNLEDPFSSDWFELGYINEDGVTLTPNLTTNPYRVWQSRLPAKIVSTDLTFEVMFTMAQMNQGTTSIFFFDAQWVETEVGVYRLDVASDQILKERAMAVEYTDDAGHTNRLIVPRGFVSNREALQLQRNAVSEMGITYQALDQGGDAFYFLSDDPAMEPATS